MKQATTWLGRLALLVVLALFALRSGHWITCALMASLVLGSSVLRRGLAVDRTGQLLLALLGLALAWPLNLALNPEGGVAGPQSLGTLGTMLTLMALLIALPRLFIAAPSLGEGGSAALNVLAVLGCAHSLTGWTYAFFLVPYAAIQGAALRAADPGRPILRALSGRHCAATALMVVIFITVGVALALAIPQGHDWAMRKFYFTFVKSATGTSPHMQLGSLQQMVSSDKIVLRVYGPSPDRLRGFVFTRYSQGGEWRAGRDASRMGVTLPPMTFEQQDRTRITTVAGDRSRYFLPLQARALSAGEGRALVSKVGIVQVPTGEKADEIQFKLGPRDRFQVAPPIAEDLSMPVRLQARLRALASQWTMGKHSSEARLGAIQHKLRTQFKYSLSFQRRRGRDPLMDFLTRDRQGHCEYFASAMALLSRAAGIPSRVVTGYLVHERNPLGDHFVVRELNAHSWVEAWIKGRGWQTYDPTPATDLVAARDKEMSFLAALADLVASGLSAAWRRVKALTPSHLVVVVGSLLVMWVAVRIFRRRNKRPARGPSHLLAYHAPLPGLEKLLKAMAQQGPHRKPSEPLESYARRLALDPGLGALGGEASRLLFQYAAWRYGDKGDAGVLARELDDLIRAVNAENGQDA